MYTVNFLHWVAGMEGWCMWLLSKFGEPQPRTKEEVHVVRRVWAQKPTAILTDFEFADALAETTIEIQGQ
ncbi:hypothetical protein N7509_000018 [Penicillium cosmopolitanum]|uniref:Uncharacterized protein n=1 Tax=Penicillium cosmopolitanum TaxID=1131564 RepID=A0A9X0BF81_9EURO|nr:uncharacterized protein N7509_000018 [Penicillium cosmopolitanum]KAJ5414920.1 hypothetical protein N7509_000018 [Penicillium cosmopolitanum]